MSNGGSSLFAPTAMAANSVAPSSSHVSGSHSNRHAHSKRHIPRNTSRTSIRAGAGLAHKRSANSGGTLAGLTMTAGVKRTASGGSRRKGLDALSTVLNTEVLASGKPQPLNMQRVSSNGSASSGSLTLRKPRKASRAGRKAGTHAVAPNGRGDCEDADADVELVEEFDEPENEEPPQIAEAGNATTCPSSPAPAVETNSSLLPIQPPTPVQPQHTSSESVERGRSTSRTRAEDEARAQAEREARALRARSRSRTAEHNTTAVAASVPGSAQGNGPPFELTPTAPNSPTESDPVKPPPSGAERGETPSAKAGGSRANPPQPLTLHKNASNGSLSPSIRSSRSFAGFGTLAGILPPAQASGVVQPLLDTRQAWASLSSKRTPSATISSSIAEEPSIAQTSSAPSGADVKGKGKAKAPNSINLKGSEFLMGDKMSERGPAGTLTHLERANIAERLRKASGPLTASAAEGAKSPIGPGPRRHRKTSGYFGSLRNFVGLSVPEEERGDGHNTTFGKVARDRNLKRSATTPQNQPAQSGPGLFTGAAPRRQIISKGQVNRPEPLISKFVRSVELSPPEPLRYSPPAPGSEGGTPRRAFSVAGLSRTEQRIFMQRDAPLDFPETMAPSPIMLRNLGNNPGPVPTMPLTSGPGGAPPQRPQLNAPTQRLRDTQRMERWMEFLLDEADRVRSEHETTRRWRDPMAESFARVGLARKIAESRSGLSAGSIATTSANPTT